MSCMHTYTTGGVDVDVISSLTVAQQMLVTNNSKCPYMYIRIWTIYSSQKVESKFSTYPMLSNNTATIYTSDCSIRECCQ